MVLFPSSRTGSSTISGPWKSPCSGPVPRRWWARDSGGTLMITPRVLRVPVLARREMGEGRVQCLRVVMLHMGWTSRVLPCPAQELLSPGLGRLCAEYSEP